MEKKLPETLATLLTPEQVQGRRVRLMFQDEARFGRMVRIRRCWAPTPERPVVANGYEREFVYVYGAVSPVEGELDWMIGRLMNTERMSTFLAQVSAAHECEFMVMVVDGAVRTYAKTCRSQRTSACCDCLPTRRSSIRRNTSGTKCAKRNSPIACLLTLAA